MVALDTSRPIWDEFYMIAPLVVIGTKEGDHYDLAPKHMACALGKHNYFGFVCTPRHGTYQNIVRSGYFTVSFPKPGQITLTSLAATPRRGDDRLDKPIIDRLPTFKATNMDALFVKDAYLYFECKLHKIVDGFGEHSLVSGHITNAYVSEDSRIDSEIDQQSMIHDAPMLAYLQNGRFAEIKNTLAFPFPKNIEF